MPGMIVYRLGKRKWAADLTGEGARLYGGRWNNAGVPCIYASGSRALCVLEFSCYSNLDDIPRALTFTLFEIPEEEIYECSESILPGNWKTIAHSAECKAFGNKLLTVDNYLIIKIPSVVLPYEYNYLLNPAHQLFASKVLVKGAEDYSYDIRIKK